MTDHVWVVLQDGEQLGTVKAISRKGACHAAYMQFGIRPEKQRTISVVKAQVVEIDLGDRNGDIMITRTMVGIDPAMPGTDRTVNLFVDESGALTLGEPTGESVAGVKGD